jgi:3-oxoacyl-[acyl-carrier protein] reductase
MKGIGKGIACALAEAGADIVINYVVNPEEAEQVAGIIRGLGRRALLVQADISHPEQVRQMFNDIDTHFGRLDILRNQ